MSYTVYPTKKFNLLGPSEVVENNFTMRHSDGNIFTGFTTADDADAAGKIRDAMHAGIIRENDEFRKSIDELE